MIQKRDDNRKDVLVRFLLSKELTQTTDILDG